MVFARDFKRSQQVTNKAESSFLEHAEHWKNAVRTRLLTRRPGAGGATV